MTTSADLSSSPLLSEPHLASSSKDSLSISSTASAFRPPPRPTSSSSAGNLTRPRPLYKPAWVEDWALSTSAATEAISTTVTRDPLFPGFPSTESQCSSDSNSDSTCSTPPTVMSPTALTVPGAEDDGPLTVGPRSSRPVPKSASSTSMTVPGGGRGAPGSGDAPSIWAGFYKRSLKERQNRIRLAFPHMFDEAASAWLNDSGTSEVPTQTSPQRSSSSGTDNPSLASSLDAAAISPGMLRMAVSGSNGAGIPMSLMDDKFPICGLDEDIADHMIENCIGTMGMPVGLALNFVIDGVPTVVPMAVEEPSVVAAVSGAAKVLCSADSIGFRTSTPERNIITAQVQLLDILDQDMESAEAAITSQKKEILAIANQHCVNMHKRGGGAVNLLVRRVPRLPHSPTTTSVTQHPRDATTAAFLAAHLPPTDPQRAERQKACNYWLVVHIHVDVCDAMGANCASTVAEGTSQHLAALAGHGARVGLRIVTNLNPVRLSRASFRVPVSTLAYKGFTGEQVAARVIEAYQWACDDVYRATTHNKGIMNGIDAVALATGQDWRAVEAACHSWAAGNGAEEQRTSSPTPGIHQEPAPFNAAYSSLTRYWVEQGPGTNGSGSQGTWYLCGSLAIPVIVGTRGGALSTTPLYQYTLGMMGFPSSRRLAAILCCVGLAQNFAALRALATEGIQRGHMHLHARNIAIAAGAPSQAIAEVTQWMIDNARISVDAASEYIMSHHLYASMRRNPSGLSISSTNTNPESNKFF
ncbi:hypothetical protein BC828DRAFT_386598 [Blastocladiella britannica]|nr:hypothetical protein BC828DRAFT_386598 [Blastocladiella britannica]